MSDTAIFAVVLGGLFVLRFAAVTVVFYYILPNDDRCPNCDAATARVQARWIGRLLPHLRNSWCMRCGWEGFLREGALTPEPQPTEMSKTSR
jgi:hypothetical protein